MRVDEVGGSLDFSTTRTYRRWLLSPSEQEADARTGSMLFSRYRTCSKQLNATARICPRCGALTGVNTRSRDRAIIYPLSFSAAAVVVVFAFVLLKWLGSLP